MWSAVGWWHLALSVGIACISLAADEPSAANPFTSESVAKLIFAATLLIVGYLGAQSHLTSTRGR